MAAAILGDTVSATNFAIAGFSVKAVSLTFYEVRCGRYSVGSFRSGPWHVLHPKLA